VCGIVACHRAGEAVDFLLQGLGRLEYRGYDSAGVALTGKTNNALLVRRAVGRVNTLQSRLNGDVIPTGLGIGIGHTRWATHGSVTETNAHPHQDCNGDVAVVHNGIIENAGVLRVALQQRGHHFWSEVDTEVIAHLVEDARREGADLASAVRSALRHLEGSWALAVVAGNSDCLVVAANRSPLAIGEAADGGYVASDVAALLDHADRIRVLADGDVVELNGVVRWTDRAGRSMCPRPLIKANWTTADADLGAFADFTQKEIAEQPAVAARLLDALLPTARTGELWPHLDLPPFERVRLVACGTSLHAAAVTAGVLRSVGRFPTEVVVASEHTTSLPQPKTLTMAFSQSGETADVLAALRAYSDPVLAVTNVAHSTLARTADAVITCQAGLEVGVAATKTFTAQVLAGATVAIAAACNAGRIGHADAEALFDLLANVPERLRDADENAGTIVEAVAELIADAPSLLFVSRGDGLPYAAEGALKWKELSYRWAEAYAAGELKHGPIALIDRGTPVVVIGGGARSKLNANVSEMRARGATVLTVDTSPQATFPVSIAPQAPWGPLEAVVPLQHLARALAVRLGRDVDKPRNLAKSVTVE
jgi:glutamine---fructose-6-phosphate transaminase (isomerizing)